MMLNDDFDQDEYGEVYNGAKTYTGIAGDLENRGSIIIGWTDLEGSHLDILFCVQPIQVGSLQRGMSAYTDLFVAVSHFGMFGFEINGNELHPGYVGEKLGLGNGVTTDRVTELITEVRKRLT